MIRVAIVADRLARVQRLAEMLEEDDRFEVVPASGFVADRADVILAIDVPVGRLAVNRLPVVVVGGDRESVAWDGTTRAALPANVSDAEIVAALAAAASNLTVLTPAQTRKWLRQTPVDDERRPMVEKLTPRELEVLQMLAAGMGNKEIAQELGISPHTAKFHVAQIIAKLQAAGRTEAVATGIREGLIAI